MAIIQVEHPVINESSFEPQNRQDGISGVMLIHNEAEFLAQVIDTWIDAVDELVIVFNDCTDNSPEIIEEYERKYYPKIRAFHYLQRVYSPNTKEQLELDVNNINSFTFYSNFNLSQTRYKICVVINGDHVGIPEYLKKIYNFLKTNPLQNTALFFSGLNLWKHPDYSQYCISLKDIALGDGDLAYWTVSPNHIFVKNSNNPLLTIVRCQGLEYYYLGFIFWHTRFLKKDYGQGNYGVYSENLNQFLESKIREAKLVPLSLQFKQKNKGFQYISYRRFSLYFDFESLPEVVGVDSVIEILQQALQHYQANRFTQAEQAYHQVLNIQPEHPEALYRLGILTEQMGNYQKAEELLSRALQVQPNSVLTWFSLANLRQSQGQFTAAIDAYRQALKLRPDSAPIYNNLGYTFYQQGEWDKAIACYEKALELKPKFIEADVNLGNALHIQGKLLPEQQIHYGMLNCQLGESRSKIGDWQTAIAYYRQAIVLQPDLVEAHHYLSVALQQSILTELQPSQTAIAK
ncbi:MAG: tetratricopeptide repeat protein [Nostoc sp. NMS1]|uniref:tetratricopeptide repeat protein n=1 Tax=unclassified Nostoc TaxID=2593658 RepID=UPI0025E1D3F0|nr:MULTISPECIES: tetratricopeptide repeat protein [unclassified Nostoc]MBN3909464.1 tetratricopeptide repeat protein [Nostoc sp. NMS1]MBN3994299.1 tetratricopeptide repeat protein [Nostoc sp. NMS2]